MCLYLKCTYTLPLISHSDLVYFAGGGGGGGGFRLNFWLQGAGYKLTYDRLSDFPAGNIRLEKISI